MYNYLYICASVRINASNLICYKILIFHYSLIIHIV